MNDFTVLRAGDKNGLTALTSKVLHHNKNTMHVMWFHRDYKRDNNSDYPQASF